jgi:hypothetical protein
MVTVRFFLDREVKLLQRKIKKHKTYLCMEFGCSVFSDPKVFEMRHRNEDE